MPKSRKYLDTVGMCASVLCMVHCLGTPIVVAFLAGSATLSASSATAAINDVPPTDLATAESHTTESHDTAATCSDTASCCESPSSTVTHASFLGLALPLGLWTWAAGYRRHHCKGSLAVGGIGLVLLTAGLLGVPWPGEQPFTIMGSLCIAAAHWWNHKRMSCCEESNTPAEHDSPPVPA